VAGENTSVGEVWMLSCYCHCYCKQVATVKEYGLFGFKASTPCLNVMPNGSATGPVCAAPDEHLYYDNGHPSSARHRFLAQTVVSFLFEHGLLQP
jgi:phospholipase/lecithinase/hemolysin